MSGVRDELMEMARGFRWGRRPLVPRSAEPFAPEKEDPGFPTDWARTEMGTATRQAILKAKRCVFAVQNSDHHALSVKRRERGNAEVHGTVPLLT